MLQLAAGEAMCDVHRRYDDAGGRKNKIPSDEPPPLLPTLLFAFKLGGFRIPTSWSKTRQRCQRYISKVHASEEWARFLSAYDEFIRDVVAPASGDAEGIYYQRPPTLRVAMPSRRGAASLTLG